MLTILQVNIKSYINLFQVDKKNFYFHKVIQSNIESNVKFKLQIYLDELEKIYLASINRNTPLIYLNKIDQA
ncbi:unnamed protein product [Paramecium sonneborni]|uniref:Uncharacterized protein n=1 Tax=Paramecium sonneborni TaxID=65129 RepID=A0A8S1NFU5_9CILI|nr:unnamed protein product [Paramecium sonneborni]